MLRVAALLGLSALLVGCAADDRDHEKELVRLKMSRGKIEQKFEIEDSQFGPEKLTGGTDVPFLAALNVFNGTKAGIESADFVVECTLATTKQIVYKTPPIHVEDFGSFLYHGAHALLPRSRPVNQVVLKFNIPSKYWRTDTSFRAVLVADKVVKPRDLKVFDEAVVALNNWDLKKVTDAVESTVGLDKWTYHEGGNFMYLALNCGRKDVVDYLLAHGYDFAQAKGTPRDAFLHAVCSDNVELAQMVFDRGGVDLNKAYGDTKKTALHYCVVAGIREMPKWLLKQGADPNRFDSDGDSPLALAIKENEIQGAEILVDGGADIHWHDKHGMALMHFATTNPVFCELLVKHGADINEQSGPDLMTPIQTAALHGSGTSKWLVEHGAKPELKDRRGRDAFDYAKDSNTLHTDRFFRRLIGR